MKHWPFVNAEPNLAVDLVICRKNGPLTHEQAVHKDAYGTKDSWTVMTPPALSSSTVSLQL